jgi:hypothetical protein
VSLKPIMTAAGKLGHAPGSLVSGGVFTVTTAPSLKSKIGGVGVHRGTVAYTFAGGSAAGFVSGSVTGGGAVTAGAIKTRADGLPVVLEGDRSTMVATGAIPGGGSGPVTGLVEVANAGQDKVNAQ